jgi:hypothetical protein
MKLIQNKRKHHNIKISILFKIFQHFTHDVLPAEILILRKFEYIEFEKCVNDDNDCSFILYTINKYCQFYKKKCL